MGVQQGNLFTQEGEEEGKRRCFTCTKNHEASETRNFGATHELRYNGHNIQKAYGYVRGAPFALGNLA
jgi:hypothetical protein